ncbi:unnamed protein product [Caenorhabditis bovis]|uniref:Uncharacterized protein n=1 Tax=Caenorhabditis bovis TaxID=2654633 RepID=A0A8S1EMK2_9PELO|nr:unnamed protein product [Caenorhabditis bovis]
MSEILPLLYLGNRLNASCDQQLKDNRIMAILSIHDRRNSERNPCVENFKHIEISDTVDADISSKFAEAIEFVHCERLRNHAVLVHCLMGQSRSATVVAAYVATLHGLDGSTALQFVRNRRKQANPNVGFIMQLNRFTKNESKTLQNRLLSYADCAQLISKDKEIINKYCPFSLP